MSSEWINHDGGDMPEWLTDEFIIETECRYLGCKSRHTLHGKPSDFGWPHGRAEDEGYDPIIRFRVVASETDPQWLDEVRALWPRGERKVAAINLYREKTGASLKEAKAAVEDLE